jgi:GDP-4-dehydro-6-deoxy-D-mannose reductase
MKDRVLILGVSGFIGQHLANEILLDKKIDVYGIDICKPKWLHLDNFSQIDISNVGILEQYILEIKPQIIFSLMFDFEDNDSNLAHINNLFQLVSDYNPRTKVVISSSSAQYGKVPNHNIPVTEEMQFNPISKYGHYKVLEELEARRLASEYNVNLSIARIFNVTGPYEPERLVGGAMINKINSITGKNLPLYVHNLKFKRDFLDVRDVARGLMLIGIKGRQGHAYNVCSNSAIEIGDYIQIIAETLNPMGKIQIIEETNGDNNTGIECLIGDNRKLSNEIGWKKKYSLHETIYDMLNTHKR